LLRARVPEKYGSAGGDFLSGVITIEE